MTAPARERCASCAWPGPNWHGGGAWLIVHKDDAASLAVAKSAAQDCIPHGVDPRPTLLDEVDRRMIWSYSGLILILPGLPDVATVTSMNPTVGDGVPGLWDGSTASVSDFVSLLGMYRSRRTFSLLDIPPRYWNELGIVQWIGPRLQLTSQAMRNSLKDSDVCHFLDEGKPNLFDPFGPNSLREQQEIVSGSQQAAVARRLLRSVSEWGIAKDDVISLLEQIDLAREIFRDPRFSQISTPIAGSPKSRFDFVLDGENEFEKAQMRNYKTSAKSWGENGARACNMALAEIQLTFPNFARPTGRRNKRGLQDDLRKLYRELRVLAPYLRRETSRPEWPNS